ncbi:MAG: putative motility protein [Candidatus Sedimenticola sp. PURPLELP]
MQIAGVSTTQLAQVDNSSDPARLAFAVGVQRDSLDHQEQVAQQLIRAIDQPTESRQSDSRVGQNIDLYA